MFEAVSGLVVQLAGEPKVTEVLTNKYIQCVFLAQLFFQYVFKVFYELFPLMCTHFLLPNLIPFFAVHECAIDGLY